MGHTSGNRSPIAFFKASASDNGGGCVEVGMFTGGVAVRDSKSSCSPVLFFTDLEWEAFLEGVRAGEFDLR